MTKIIEFATESGETVHVEVAERGPQQIGADHVEKATESLERALSTVRPFVVALVRVVHDLPIELEEVGASFGIALKGQASAIIASTAVEGNVSVSLKWKPKKVGPPGKTDEHTK